MTASHPTETFASLGVPADLAACLEGLGIAEPYPVQVATLPDGFAGRDVFAQSPTGSGKTLAFALPMVARTTRSRPGHPRGLVLAPTRELAAQIAETIRTLGAVNGRRVATVYGGVGYVPQLKALRAGVDILVGCPGRLIDLLEQNALHLGDVEVVVVDEADRMADMGFLPAVRRLLDETPVSRQTMLFSATLVRDVEKLVREYQRNPSRHLLELPAHEVGLSRHEFWRAGREERATLTADLVGGLASSIVFCRTKHGADRLARQLERSGVVAVAIHGDRSQSQRDRALEQFRQRRAQVLVGTDVASRGLHVDNVDCVVHFDPPADDDTYVHRSGRTGRAGASGLVVSLVTSDQEREALALAKRLGVGSGLSAPGTAAVLSDSRVAASRPLPARPLPAAAPPAGPPATRRARPPRQGASRPYAATARPSRHADQATSDRRQQPAGRDGGAAKQPQGRPLAPFAARDRQPTGRVPGTAGPRRRFDPASGSSTARTESGQSRRAPRR